MFFKFIIKSLRSSYRALYSCLFFLCLHHVLLPLSRPVGCCCLLAPDSGNLLACSLTGAFIFMIGTVTRWTYQQKKHNIQPVKVWKHLDSRELERVYATPRLYVACCARSFLDVREVNQIPTLQYLGSQSTHAHV